MNTRRDFLTKAAIAGGSILLPELSFARDALPPPPATAAKSCILIDAVTGAPLMEKNADERRAVASTQKLVSALVITGQSRNNLDHTTIVQPGDTKIEPTKLYIKAGEKYDWKTLFNAMLIESCNDCARCLGRTVAGTEAAFAGLMNAYALRLGMKNSNFRCASGLPMEGQYSTARDMARAARAAIYNPIIRNTVSQAEVTITRPDGRVSVLSTTNHLLRRTNANYTPICTGMKTGFTNAAGKCLISSANLRGKAIICVMLGSNSKIIWKESRALLHWAFGLTN